MTYTIDHTHKSPNFSSRDGRSISMIVLHSTVGSARSALDWLTTPASRVSTHYLIDKAGKIYQLVDDLDAAWHAGKSAWFGLDSEEIQQCSLGVELENLNDGRDPYPRAQLDAAEWLCRSSTRLYAIVPDMVVRHLDIAIPRGRKTDPAGFPWASFKAALFAPPPPPVPAPPPPAVPYRVKGLPVYQRADHTGALWGHLVTGEQVVIDDPKNGHLADGRGFVDLAGLEPL